MGCSYSIPYCTRKLWYSARYIITWACLSPNSCLALAAIILAHQILPLELNAHQGSGTSWAKARCSQLLTQREAFMFSQGGISQSLARAIIRDLFGNGPIAFGASP